MDNNIKQQEKIDNNEKLNIFQKLQKIRYELTKKNLQKSGYNTYSKFYYYELKDFLPEIIELCNKEKLFTMVKFDKENSILAIINTENINETIEFTSPNARFDEIKGIQQIGALETYQRRYLYMVAFEISENDIIDSQSQDEKSKRNEKSKPNNNDTNSKNEYISDKQIDKLKEDLRELNVQENYILELYKIKSFKEMTNIQLEDCKRRIDITKKQKKKE